MNLDQQLQKVITEAPQDGSTPILIEKAVVPILRLLAQRLQHLEYHVLQSLDGGWALTTLSHREQPGVEKHAVYAFATIEAARRFQNQPEPDLIATPIPVAELLFQLFALQQASSILFMETPGDLNQGIEIQREELEQLVRLQWQEWNQSRPVPPDIG